MTELGRYSPSSIVEHSGHLVRYHQGTAPHVEQIRWDNASRSDLV